ncbi:hypothetical protein ACQ86N_26415 [Puia sp. P3]|uniref:hypothetical protein n=1 Tax=Puia sp. P3 TaxID=3423952 RepID=UPI003D676E27
MTQRISHPDAGFVTVKGGRERNLKNISPRIPRDAIVTRARATTRRGSPSYMPNLSLQYT